MVAARLPYVLAFRFRFLANGLQVNHLGFPDVELDFVFIQNAVAELFQMQLAHPADDALSLLGFRFNSDGRILLGKMVQCTLEGIAVINAPWTDDNRYYGTVLGVRFAHGAALLVTVIV
jgi:hypothetical protein